ncbi:hypothetical protein F511_29469 [Dorcoceras hygrometricum]|uniref:Stress response protein nst1-like n=1 Tax=Dorcoceras hygrometricum TaxID=472368 RepID=A0A2Z7ADY2_9LAMI|nr:hypothetical protein F511_29469 [Dorcoceras hygrometricum]
MLPWLVIPLIGLWGLSQLLPPAFRFEITSPRLACVFVLLVTLFWYEVLMPQLSSWRVRRNALLREKKRLEAIQMHKLRKTATRRCRNCLTPYRDQNPGGGKFMCSYCGHISKRPVLDLPVPPGMGKSGILYDLVGKGGKILNGKTWSGNGLLCGQEWLEDGSLVGAPFSGKSNYWKKNGCGFHFEDDHCLAEKSYYRLFVFIYKAFASFFVTIMWRWRKIFRVSSAEDDGSTDAQYTGMLDPRSDNEVNGLESRGEKARRKAEEKRQAKLEKELMEEEERKQREEVARLVEEQRRLRDSKLEIEKESGKGSPRTKKLDDKKEAERKRQERKKERDRGSSKSNSDAEELERRSTKESDRNKSEADVREQRKNLPETMKSHTQAGHGFRSATANNQYRLNTGTRYLDRMRGSFLSSSRAFTGGSFFGKSVNASALSREQKSNISLDHSHTSLYRKETADRVTGRANVNGDDKTASRPVFIESQPLTAPKKSWQQLFTSSSDVSQPSNTNVLSRPNGKCLTEVQCPPFSVQTTEPQSYDNPVTFGLPSPVGLHPTDFGSMRHSTDLPLPSPALFSKTGNAPHPFLPEESEIFEDPCYVPDPISLLGPVSESLENFQLDLGIVTDLGLDKPCAVKTIAPPSETTKPSPIESPLSRSRVSEEKRASSQVSLGVPKSNDYSVDDSGTWQMWKSSPIVQDGLGLLGGSVNWFATPEMNEPKKEDISSVPHKTMASLFKKDEQVIPGTRSSPDVLFGNFPSGGKFNDSLPASMDGPWLPKPLYGLDPSGKNHVLVKSKEEATQIGHVLVKSKEEATQNVSIHRDYDDSATKFELSTSNSLTK